MAIAFRFFREAAREAQKDKPTVAAASATTAPAEATVLASDLSDLMNISLPLSAKPKDIHLPSTPGKKP